MKNVRTLGILAPLVFALVFPLLFSNPAVTTIAVFTLIFAGAVVGWNVFSGYTGYISLGHATFYGLGAYILTIICQVWNIPGGFFPFFLLPVVGLVTGLCSLPLGWIALKTRRHVFMVLSIAIFALSAQSPNLLSGLITGMSEQSLPIPTWSWDTYNLPFYYTALVILLLALGVSWCIRYSKYGLSLLAIRDDEDRAQGLGVKVGPYKLGVYVISAIFVGMAGAMNVYFLGFISPTSAFDRSFNIAIPLMAFLGGLGTLSGPLIGALVVVPLQQYLTVQYGKQGWDLILYGVFFLLIMLVLPEGIIPALSKRWSMWMNFSSKINTPETLPIASNEITFALSQLSSAPIHNTSIGPIEKSASIIVPQRSWPSVLQETTAQVNSNVIQQPYRVPSPIPHHHSIQPTTKELTQKVRVPRLVSVPQTGSAPRPATKTILPNAMPCPECSEPLVVWGGTQFCTRCGFVPSHPKSPSQEGG
jgi:branched-chain amino acid transport system permease protein